MVSKTRLTTQTTGLVLRGAASLCRSKPAGDCERDPENRCNNCLYSLLFFLVLWPQMIRVYHVED